MGTIPLGQFVGPPGPTPSPEDMKKMDWMRLYQMRLKATDPIAQAEIAPYEHRAYAREQVAADPTQAATMALAIPGYQALKSVVGRSRTPPSWQQVIQGYAGIADGLSQRWNQPNGPSGILQSPPPP